MESSSVIAKTTSPVESAASTSGRSRLTANWFDFAIVVVLFAAGIFYHASTAFWSREQVGQSQCGDADFWWNGALHVARGLVLDGYGEGFRPGFFYIAGLPGALFQWSYQQFHLFFLVIFLAAAAWLYLSLRPVLGRLASALALIAITFNPVTAEWTATGTTDATGMALSMAVVSLLVTAVWRQWSSWRLISSGLLFSLANLTRPLMVPFIGLASLALFGSGYSQGGVRRGLALSAKLLLAFLLPALLWMGAQKLIVGEASLSQNDASAFYAASDPHIKVWNSNVYDRATAEARKATGRESVSLTEQNAQFWRMTVSNYRENLSYHLSRVLPHFWAVANFSSLKSPRARYGLERIAIRLFLGIVLASGVATVAGARCRIGSPGEAFAASKTPGAEAAGFGRIDAVKALALPALLLALSYLFSGCLGLLVLGGVILPFLSLWGRQRADGRRDLPFVFLSLYWLSGAAALYLVGGVLFDLRSLHTAWSGLGFRLIDQFYFVALILAFYFIERTTNFSSTLKEIHSRWSQIVEVLRLDETRTWGIACFAPLIALALLLVSSELAGAVVVAWRVNERSHATPRPFPDTGKIALLCREKLDRSLNRAVNRSEMQVADRFVGPVPRQAGGRLIDSRDYLVTGSTTEFIWNLAGQKRTTLAIYEQKNLTPFTMHPNRLIVDIPESVDRHRWQWRQGAFLLRAIPTTATRTDLPYYVDRVAVRAFIPLNDMHTDYAVDRAKWFPIRKYATDLLAGNEFEVSRGRIICYDENPGFRPYERHFLLDSGSSSSVACLKIDTEHARGARRLSFGFGWNVPPAADQEITCAVFENGGSRIGSFSLPAVQKYTQAEVDLGELSRPPGPQAAGSARMAPARSVELRFNGLPQGGVWVYELNLQADDFVY